MRYIFIWLFLLLFYSSCTKNNQVQPIPSFYHWQQNLSLSTSELQLLDDLQANKLYVRLFDLDLNQAKTEVIPFSIIGGDWPTDHPLEIVPTFFITNRSMENKTPAQIDSLALKLIQKSETILKDAPPNLIVNSWQLDCDWTQGTKEMYFRFVDQVRQRLSPKGIQLSCTIRLHQIKYADKTGIPPADRGMLMFYNMDNVRDLNTQNSIIDLDIAKQYLVGFDKYPLALDLALPVFSWAVWMREGKTLGLLYPFDASVLNDTSRIKSTAPQQFQLLKSTYLDGRYLYEGDQLRLESANPEVLFQSMDLLKDQLPSEQRTLAFYSLDSTLIKNFSPETLKQIINRWNPEN